MTASDVEAPPRAANAAEAVAEPMPRLAALAALVVAADVLLYGPPPGVSFTIFLAAVCACSAVANARSLSALRLALALAVLAVGLAPGAVSFNVLSALFGVAGAAMFVRIAIGGVQGGASREALAALWTACFGPIQALIDARPVLAALMRYRAPRELLAWGLPAALGVVFLFLFRAANPIIDDALARIDLARFFESLSAARIALWIAVAAVCWSFVFAGRLGGHPPGHRDSSAPPASPAPLRDGTFFGRAAVLRSLVVFNLLFAAQTGMDLAYLWADARLPEGVTYAAYAHRGVYALLAAALLSAGFMVTAMRSGSAAERSPIIRMLAYLWMAQNVLLVASSMRRLGLYVEAYALTSLRVAALLWMLLVAVGLVLILGKIAFRRSTAWLVWSNAAAAALTLYICSFVSFASVIADYNVTNSREMGGAGPALDIAYLCTLGPEALPAIERATQAREGWIVQGGCEDVLRAQISARSADWRSWTYRNGMLASYVEDNPGCDGACAPPAGLLTPPPRAP